MQIVSGCAFAKLLIRGERVVGVNRCMAGIIFSRKKRKKNLLAQNEVSLFCTDCSISIIILPT